MKTLRLAAPLALLAAAALAADVPPVVAPTARTASLGTAQKLLAPREAAAPANLVDPFHSEAFATAAATSGTAAVGNPAAASTAGAAGAGTASAPRPAGPRTTRDILQTIGDALRPGGFIVMGGQPSLSFGQKRVKPGGTLTITFEGAEYTVEVTKIDHVNFTLRLNNEEYTRPIKK
ncbi:hypothetical protein [Oleiharenicola sp. Vm1]|uniref:hypothetical protein n=1 Tax=Oleiharenicola sp. Vm1 TaxID=3398393 RepID=UPI0039F470E5